MPRGKFRDGPSNGNSTESGWVLRQSLEVAKVLPSQRETPFSQTSLMELGSELDKDVKLECAVHTGRKKRLQCFPWIEESAPSWVTTGNSIHLTFTVSWNSDPKWTRIKYKRCPKGRDTGHMIGRPDQLGSEQTMSIKRWRSP